MSSGVAVSDDCVNKYNELKVGRQYKYIFYKISEDFTVVEVEKTGSADATYDDFLADIKAIPKDDCRYAVFDFDFDTSDGGKRSKICFYVWAPDTARIKKKMIYASSKDALRKKLIGIGAEIQGTDISEVSAESVFDRVSRGPGNQ
ncbi:cofilin [Fonticula alba]|uniref:Cofilin n=1 Tax=Fonticula alba TaxID=691883 RepID=A0A058Z3Z7_FONAL|nr:cofilin [Fonticula alba]KCV68984.1 cofilin [Fonticula alba]|eukprot:XP_009496555.1 cofilin [Fonticula alba]